jgi:mono/diheme cytochrome c family protein
VIDDILAILLLVGLAVLFIWLAGRALRNRRWFVRWPGLILSGLLGLIFLLFAGGATRGLILMETRHANPPSAIAAATAPEALARGEEIANGCGCHSPEGQPLVSGSRGNLIEGGPPMGTLYATNLTPGGPLAAWSDGEIARAVREGIGKDGRALFAMPSVAFHNLSDADTAALIGYLRSLPPTENPQPERNMNALADAVVGFGLFPVSNQPPITQAVVAPPRAATVEYGKYVASVNTCSDCHGARLDGVPSNPFAPVGPSLIAIGKAWTPEQFVALFRQGVLPGGAPAPESMPWKELAPALSDVDLQALHAYLGSL